MTLMQETAAADSGAPRGNPHGNCSSMMLPNHDATKFLDARSANFGRKVRFYFVLSLCELRR